MKTQQKIVSCRIECSVRLFLCCWLSLCARILATSLPFASSSSSSIGDCRVGEVSWPNATTRYLAGDRFVHGSVYALCRNGTAECFLDRGVADTFEHESISCDSFHHQRRRLALMVQNRINTWPKGIVCYEFVSKFSPESHQMMLDAMHELRTSTERLEFVPLNECPHKYNNNTNVCGGCKSRVLIRNDKQGCHAHIGFRNTPQSPTVLNVADQKCDEYRIYLHELGHVVGLGHEHCHPDRKVVVLRQRLTVNAINYSKDFRKKRLAYNPQSIMHYNDGSICMPQERFAAVQFCDVNETASKHQCVEPQEHHCDRNKNKSFGPQTNLSDQDVQAIRQLYLT